MKSKANVFRDFFYSWFFVTTAAVVFADAVEPKGQWLAGRDDGSLRNLTTIEIAGTRAYLRTAAGYVRCFDISNPLAPKPLGSAPILLAAGARNLAVSGNYVFYPATYSGGFGVYDFSAPAAPIDVVKYLPFDGGNTEAVAVEGNRVYLAKRDGVDIIDITSISSPTFLARYPTAKTAWFVTARNNLVYVATESSFLVLDATDGHAPQQVSAMNFAPDTLDHVRLHQQYAILGGTKANYGKRTMFVVDISNPAAPHQTDEIMFANDNPYFNALGGAYQGNYAFQPTGSGIATIDISTPGAMHEIGHTSGLINDADVAIFGNYVFTAALNDGLISYDVSDPRHPSQAGAYFPVMKFASLATSGNFTFIEESSGQIPANGRIHVVNTSDPASPTEAGYTLSGRPPGQLILDGSRLFVLRANQFDYFDVSTPPAVKYIGSSDVLSFFGGLGVKGNFVFASSQFGLHCYELFNGTIISNASVTLNDGGAVRIAGNYAFVVRHESVSVVDISNPLQMQVISDTEIFTDTPASSTMSIAVDQGKLFAFGADGLKIFDLSNPAQIGLPITYPTSPGELVVAGSGVVFLGRATSIEALNVTDPLHPVSITTITLNSALQDLQQRDEVLYASTTSGLQIFQITPPPPPPSGPALHATIDGSNVVFKWPDTFPHYALYSSTALGGEWFLVTNSPDHSGSNFVVTNRFATAPAKFYRLLK